VARSARFEISLLKRTLVVLMSLGDPYDSLSLREDI
jgi:hypothetical protein